MEINLISDTITRPCSGMLNAMMNARVGDDVFKQDETVNLLENRVAQFFGMEAGLFFPSGTMANQTAIKIHTQPGDQLICDKYAHIYNYEGGGVSFNSGVSCKLIDGDRGMMTANQIEEGINPPDFYHSPTTTLVCIENTTNKGGGACWNLDELNKIKEVCNRHNLKYHLDGARLWNALVAKNQQATDFGRIFDTISVCFSKGLGCPVGSMLIGQKHHIEAALRIRKKLGGGMRQVGYIAAAALYALDHNIERLAVDHNKAKEIGLVLQQMKWVKKVEPIETNIVIFEVEEKYVKTEEFMSIMESKGIKLIAMGSGKLRMVTHLDYTDTMHDYFLSIMTSLSR